MRSDLNLLLVLGQSPYNDSDVAQLEPSDSSSDATASCSATCSTSDNSGVWDNNASQRLVSAATPSMQLVSLCANVYLSHLILLLVNVLCHGYM